jgi:hypothetical protein
MTFIYIYQVISWNFSPTSVPFAAPGIVFGLLSGKEISKQQRWALLVNYFFIISQFVLVQHLPFLTISDILLAKKTSFTKSSLFIFKKHSPTTSFSGRIRSQPFTFSVKFPLFFQSFPEKVPL